MIKSTHAVLLGFLVGTLALIVFSFQIALSDNIAIASSGFSQGDKSVQTSNNTELDTTQQETCSLSAQYPQTIQQWCNLIDAKSKKYNIEKELLAAVMLQESGGDAQAYSSSGAVGLMQIMPRDGIAEKFVCINGPCFANRPSMNELFNPEFNVEFGASYLSSLYNHHGNWRDALKNYGPMDIGYYYSDLVLNIIAQYQ